MTNNHLLDKIVCDLEELRFRGMSREASQMLNEAISTVEKCRERLDASEKKEAGK